MARLPNPGGDDGQWGDILNDYLSQEIKSDGTLKIRTDNTFANKTHASTHYPGGSDPLAYSLSGTVATRPTASASNAGLLYLATDENGGTTYRSNGTAWVQVAAAVTGGGGSPSGAAGGDLTGSTYPNPTIKSSVALSGSPTTTTQSASDNSTKIATTAYVDNKDSQAVALTNKDLTSGTNTFPTFNQNTTGTASKATNLIGGNGTTLLGSIPYQSGVDTTTQLGPNTTSTKKFLRQTGTGTNGAAPAWDTIVAGDIPSLDALTAPAADLSINSHKLTNVTDPTSDQDGATKAYTDKNTNKLSVKAATTTTLASYTGTGTGILTGSSNGALGTIDGITLTAGDRFLLKNGNADGSAHLDNGIYTVTTVGDGSTKYVITRASDANTTAKMSGGVTIYVQQGTLYSGVEFVLSTTAAITLNTTPLLFAQLTNTNMANVRRSPTPTSNKLLGWTVDVASAAGSAPVTSAARIYFQRINVPVDITVTNVLLTINTPTPGALTHCYVALYSSSGAGGALTMISGTQSTDQATSGSSWSASTGQKTVPIGTPTFIAGGPNVAIWVAIYYGTTGGAAVTLLGNAGSAATMNVGLTAGTDELRCCYANMVDGTTLTSPVNWSAMTIAQLFFVALS